MALLTIGAGAVWGFTVDDALIPARYAHHLATGRGYSFSPGGPATDGVTPLGFAHVLVPFARQGVAHAHLAAKWLGLVAWLAGGAMLAFAVARAGQQRVRYVSLFIAALSLPAAAWAVAGLETGVVAGLVGVAVSLRSLGRAEPLGTLLLGLAAGWRPELAPMALVLGVPRAGSETHNVEDASLEGEGVATPKFGLDRGHLARTLIALTPLVVVAAARAVWFGQAAPLSSIAKRPSLDLGLVYAGSCALVAGPVAVVAPFALRRAPAFTRWLAIAVGTHLVAVAIAGGDWMPLSRLVVPCVPVVVVAVARLSDHATVWATALRVAIAIGFQLAVASMQLEKARRVEADRAHVIEQVRPWITSARVVAGLDVGWLGVAAPDSSIVDLAGVTDPAIARLPGGHTTKRLPDGLLDDREVDAVVLLASPADAVDGERSAPSWQRGVESALARNESFCADFEPVRRAEGRLPYVVFRRRHSLASEGAASEAEPPDRSSNK